MLRTKFVLILALLALISCSKGGDSIVSNDGSSGLYLASFEDPDEGLPGEDISASFWKWGFINNKGKEVIDAKFKKADYFSEGLARVCVEKKECGFINEKGKFVIDPIYENALSFSEGYAAVMINGKWGFIDKRGNIIIDPVFEIDPDFSVGVECLYFHDGYALIHQQVEEDVYKWGFIDKDGNFLIDPILHFALPFSEGLAYIKREFDSYTHEFIDTSGNTVIKIEGLYGCGMFSEGLSPCLDMNFKGGFIDTNSNVVIDYSLSMYSRDFHDGYAAYFDSITETYGYINKKGEIEIPSQYKEASDFSEGLACVKTESAYGFINKKGIFTIQPQYEGCCDFNNSLAHVTTSDEGCYINKSGEKIWCSDSESLVCKYKNYETNY